MQNYTSALILLYLVVVSYKFVNNQFMAWLKVITKNRKFVIKFSNSYFGTGPAECADAAEALESVSFRFRFGTLRPPRGGGGFKVQARIPPGLRKS